MIERSDITALILAGGAGSRMGGVDKGWVDYEELPLVVHALNIVCGRCGATLVSANRNVERYAALGVTVVRDLTTDYQGPIAGILAGAVACSTPWMWIMPVDCPKAPPLVLDRLLASANRTGAGVAVAHDGLRDQPLFMLLNQSAQARLLNYYLSGNRSIRDWLRSQVYVRTNCRDIKAGFLNVNEIQHIPPRAAPSENYRLGGRFGSTA